MRVMGLVATPEVRVLLPRGLLNPNPPPPPPFVLIGHAASFTPY